MKRFKTYLARAMELPPHVVARKAVGLGVRAARDTATRLRDRTTPSYGSPIDAPWTFSVAFEAERLGEAEREALAFLTAEALDHRLDLLGSGFVDLGYGVEAQGLEGISFEPPAEAREIGRLRAPWMGVSRANRTRARQIFELIGGTGYRPIDWQKDLRSGYRWSAKTFWQDLRIGRDRGADIKLPWELARMQHLPQFAIAAALSAKGDTRFAVPERYAAEIRSQILDFLAANPPRYGAAWGCPMDVGIRAANWVLAVGMLKAQGLAFDPPFIRELHCGLRDAARFVAANLEWAETGRSNHYLSDLAGLLFAAAALPRSAETRTWMNFAARELACETLIEFHADGSNFEGSTNYHRLSGELVAYSLALAVGLEASEPEIFRVADEATLARMRPPIPAPERPMADVLAEASPRLLAMIEFTRWIAKPDGTFVQIGDTDSGRLFKLAPRLDVQAECGTRQENQLLADELVGALAALIGDPDAASSSGGASFAASITGGLMGTGRLPPSYRRPLPERWPPFGERALELTKERIARLPAGSKRSWRFALPDGLPDRLEFAPFTDFGLYILKGGGLFVSFRLAQHERTDAPSGHTHDDNLAIEIVVGGEDVVSDPGTFVYTPLPERRNMYRLHSAHFVPRAAEFAAVKTSEFLFVLGHVLDARALAAGRFGFAGQLEGKQGAILRVVEVHDDGIDVHDGIEGGSLSSLGQPVSVTRGYGKKTARPAYTL